MNKKKNVKKSDEATLYLSESHRKYYQFLYGTDDPAAVKAAIQEEMIKKWSKSVKQTRCKSSSDISSDITSRITTPNTDGSSTPSSNKASTCPSSISKSSVDVLNENKSKTYKNKRSQTEKRTNNGNQSDTASEAINTNEHRIVLKVDVHKASSSKNSFRSCLRRKSKSFESFFILPKSQENNLSEGDKKQDQNQIVSKIKGFFSALRSPTRCLWTSAQTSSSVTTLSVSSNQEALKKQLLSPKRTATATKLSELKSARPIQSSSESSLEPIQQDFRQSVSVEVHATSENTLQAQETIASHPRIYTSELSQSSEPILTRHQSVSDQYLKYDSCVDSKLEDFNLISEASPPPPPTPPDPSDDRTQHTFYLREDDKTEQPGPSGLRKVFLKSTISDTRLSLCESPTISSITYDFEKLSRDLELSQDIVYFKPLNNYKKSDKTLQVHKAKDKYGQHKKQQILHSAERLPNDQNSRRPFEEIKSTPKHTEHREKIESDSENHERSRYIRHKNLQEGQIEINTYEPRITANQTYNTLQNYYTQRRTIQKQYSNYLSNEEPQPSTSWHSQQQIFENPKYHESDKELNKELYVPIEEHESKLKVSSQSERCRFEAEDYQQIHCDQLRHSQVHTEQPKLTQIVEESENEQSRNQYGHTIENSQQKQREYSYIEQSQRQEQPAKRPPHIRGTLLQRSNQAFWRRENIYQLQLDSPRHSGDFHTNIFKGEGSKIYREYKQRHSQDHSPRYYQKPVLGPEHPEVQDYQYRENTESRHTYRSDHMARMGSIEDHERKVIIEFCHLLEKSKQLFNGLRELPQYGHKQWHSYFGRTFDVYTKLWKFQQQHRAILDTKYGLKRWQIGEIASKIGQLYYHFYLRTSETAYLNEAYSFYFAIRGRSYYTKASKEDKCELMVKKLRYYARFIVVCLLLKKIKLVRDLIKELDRQIIEYGNTYDPDDQIEWTVVMDEVKAFIQAEPVVSVIHPENYPIILSHRLNIQTTPPVERSALMTLSLKEVIIVGSSSYQVKFSELTMDMFRMLQTLEREPTGEIQQPYDDSPRQRYNVTPSALNNKGYSLEAGAPHCDNPHKYLLFKPTPNQILVYLASSCDDLPPNGALLVYISAEGQIATPSKHIEDGYDIGGLITTSKSDVHRDANKDQKGAQAKYRDVNSFHPGDLFPFTRRPLFVIIDSDNSYAFQNMPRHFGQPLVILMSPLELPPTLSVSTADRRNHGNLFTLFLHSPLTAFCYCCDIHTTSLIQWDKAQALVDAFLAEASLIVTRSRIDSQYLSFMGDDFLRLLILRFIFCDVVLRMHRAFRTRSQLARSSPSIPEDVLEHPALIRIVMELAVHLQVRSHFEEAMAAGLPSSKE